MACCGGARIQAMRSMVNPGSGSSPSVVEMEYFGKTSLTARGGQSGKLYRFPHTGARVQVELRDVSSLRAVPNLRRV
jgi:hypothetical protein